MQSFRSHPQKVVKKAYADGRLAYRLGWNRSECPFKGVVKSAIFYEPARVKRRNPHRQMTKSLKRAAWLQGWDDENREDTAKKPPAPLPRGGVI